MKAWVGAAGEGAIAEGFCLCVVREGKVRGRFEGYAGLERCEVRGASNF